MRVVHVICTDNFAGAERSVLLTVEALRERGHHLSVIGGEQATMTEALGRIGVGWAPGGSVAAAVFALVRVGAVDVVHAHMTAAELAAVLTRPRLRAPIVATRHFAQHRGSSLPGRLSAAVINRVDHAEVSISEFVAGRIEGPSTVVTHGLPSAPAVDLDSTTVVVIQRLEAEKDTAVALRAWHASGLGDDGWTMQVAGDGALRVELELLARSLGIERSVEWLGRRSDVGTLRARASLQLASPAGEPFGLSVLEAMAAGLPVIAADGGAHRELLGDEPALLFAPGDHRAAGALLRALAGDLDGRRRIGARLRARQQREFSLAAHGAALERCYLDLRRR